MTSSNRAGVAALRQSHDRLVLLLDGFDSASEVNAPSYCSEWTIGQVLSHLGSGAEIMGAVVASALDGSPPPERDDFQKVWDRWNGLGAEDVAAAAIDADTAFVARFEALDEAALDAVRVPMMGSEFDAGAFCTLRLGELAVHSWDIAVAMDPNATIPSEPAAFIVDALQSRVGRMAKGEKPGKAPVSIGISTTGPERQFVLGITADDVALAVGDVGAADGSLQLPAEALIRLIYGRLDAAHTPASVAIEGPVSLDALRALFPGV